MSQKYYAFISYRSVDEKWAKWLQRNLESYRMPTALCRQRSDVPARPHPCFRYHTDIQPGQLTKELHSKLEASKYLLVICSPESASSQWVGEEIRKFIELGRKDRIIPVIVKGLPYSEDAGQECYHPVLKSVFPKTDDPQTDSQILGVNVNEEGSGTKWYKRKRAVTQIVSLMFGVSFDTLWKRQRRRMVSGLVSVLIGAVAVVSAVALSWYAGQPVDIPVSLAESSLRNEELPPLSDIKAVFHFDEKSEESVFEDVAVTKVLYDVPSRYLGTKVRLTVEAFGLMKKDTVVTLGREMVLPIYRDPEVFGHISVLLYDFSEGVPLPDTEIIIDDSKVMSDGSGRIEHIVPLHEQRPYYILSGERNFVCDTLYVPCGKNDVIFVE